MPTRVSNFHHSGQKQYPGILYWRGLALCGDAREDGKWDIRAAGPMDHVEHFTPRIDHDLDHLEHFTPRIDHDLDNLEHFTPGYITI